MRAKITNCVSAQIPKIPLFLYYLVQWTWGILQNLVGGIIYLFCASKKTYRFYGAIVCPWKISDNCLSMGMFLFMGSEVAHDPRLLVHEYGHTIQSFYLGPLYLLVISLPSAIWLHFLEGYRMKKDISYYRFYCEKWADVLGQKYTGRVIFK